MPATRYALIPLVQEAGQPNTGGHTRGYCQQQQNDNVRLTATEHAIKSLSSMQATMPCSKLTDLSARLLLVLHRLLILLVQQAQLVDVFSHGRGIGRPCHKGAQAVITGPYSNGGLILEGRQLPGWLAGMPSCSCHRISPASPAHLKMRPACQMSFVYRTPGLLVTESSTSLLSQRTACQCLYIAECPFARGQSQTTHNGPVEPT